MHKGQKCILILWCHQNKIPFVENYKECAICATLRENTPFWGHTQSLKNMARVVRCTKNGAERPKNNANPSKLSQKMFIA